MKAGYKLTSAFNELYGQAIVSKSLNKLSWGLMLTPITAMLAGAAAVLAFLAPRLGARWPAILAGLAFVCTVSADQLR